MKLSSIWIAGFVLAIIGGIISWHAFLTETDIKKKEKRIAIGSAISAFGLGMFITSTLVFHNLVKT